MNRRHIVATVVTILGCLLALTFLATEDPAGITAAPTRQALPTRVASARPRATIEHEPTLVAPLPSAVQPEAIAALRTSSFGDVCAALDLRDEEVLMVAEIFAASRSDVLAAMARSAQLETLEPAVVLLITKRDEAVSSQLEKDFVERLEKYVGESRVKVLFETRNDIVIERLLDFGRTERRYVFEGNGISLASSQEIRHEIEFLLRDEHGTYGVHQGGSYAGVDAFRRAFGALAERALVGR